MSRKTKFIWCLLSALLFCAVTYGGCGGSSDMAQPLTENSTGNNTSGRGVKEYNGWEIIDDDTWDDTWEALDQFSILEGMWKITNVYVVTAPDYNPNDWEILTDDIIGSTVRITVSDRDAEAKTAKINLSESLECLFSSKSGKTIYEALIPNGATIEKFLEHSFNTPYGAQPHLLIAEIPDEPQEGVRIYNGTQFEVQCTYHDQAGDPQAGDPTDFTIHTILEAY